MMVNLNVSTSGAGLTDGFMSHFARLDLRERLIVEPCDTKPSCKAMRCFHPWRRVWGKERIRKGVSHEL